LVRSSLPLSSRKLFSFESSLLLLSFVRARARSKQARTNDNKRREDEVFSSFDVVLYAKTYSELFIRILFTSKPIHELRLNQIVANTVIALTIRVIYLSLIITLKRGVVVLWFTVTCPLSSGFLPTILPAEQFLSPKNTRNVPHTHQALKANLTKKPKIDTPSLPKT